VQSGTRSESSIESEWQRVEYLQELVQWLYCHEFPLQDCVDLLHWAVDIVISLNIQLPSWLEAVRTEGVRLLFCSLITTSIAFWSVNLVL